MKNIFAVQDYDNPNIKRNMYDFDHRENLTLDWGKIYPLGQPIEVVPGDNVHLKLSAALHAMPLVFPVQTPMTFKVFCFYVPYRLLWKNFEDYITGVYDDFTKKPVHPYHDIQTQELFDSLLKTGSLGDYLGIPSAVYTGTNGVGTSETYPNFSVSVISQSVTDAADANGKIVDDPNDPGHHDLIFTFPQRLRRSYPRPTVIYNENIDFSSEIWTDVMAHPSSERFCDFNWDTTATDRYGRNLTNPVHCLMGYYIDINTPVVAENGDLIIKFSGANFNTNYADQDTFDNVNAWLCGFEETPVHEFLMTKIHKPSNSSYFIENGSVTFVFTDASQLVAEINARVNSGYKYRLFFGTYQTNNNAFQCPWVDTLQLMNVQSNTLYIGSRASYPTAIAVARDTDFATNPFCGAVPAIPLNALPARAYECITRSYFRNDKVNPILDGNNEPIYNDYNTTHEDGADNTLYDFAYANWELDQFTDSTPTPQFGAAPLIGVTISSGKTATLEFDASSITGTSPQSSGGTLKAEVTLSDDDQMTMTGITSYDEGLPDANLKRLMQQINYGISINDIRNVNALQRFKERMLLRSYRYKDQIKNHFGVNVSNVEVDMPEYIGGYNFQIQVNKINNTAAPNSSDANGTPLGDYAGQASIFDKMNRQISKFCPEHGLIMCVGYVSPRPCYPQALPRLYTKVTDKFNYFFPEFGKMGKIPVPNAELAPLQYYASDLIHSTDTIHGTFGYQRAWYEYMSMLDGAHGTFRTNLADYLAMRLFSEPPQLNGDFIEVHPDNINNIFSVEGEDKFLGFVDYDCKIERPIPRFGMPSLE